MKQIAKWKRLRASRRLITKFNEQAAIITFAGATAATLAGLYLSADRAAVLGTGVSFLLLFAFYVLQHQTDLVPEFGDLISVDDFYVSHATPSLVDEAIEIAAEAFSEVIVPPDRVRELFSIDRTFLNVVIDRETNCAAGYIDCYPLRNSEFTKGFINGSQDESDFDVKSVMPFSDVRDGDIIYVAGLVVTEESKVRRGRMARALIIHALSSIGTVLQGGVHTVRLISVAYTRHGQKLLEGLGFADVRLPNTRKDDGILYETRMDQTTLKQILRQLGEGSHRRPVTRAEDLALPGTS